MGWGRGILGLMNVCYVFSTLSVASHLGYCACLQAPDCLPLQTGTGHAERVPISLKVMGRVSEEQP